jgi:hypothetical protein
MAFYPMRVYPQTAQGKIGDSPVSTLVNVDQVLMVNDAHQIGIGIRALTTISGMTLFVKGDAQFDKVFPGYAALSKIELAS